jgi:hypothetical protein
MPGQGKVNEGSKSLIEIIVLLFVSIGLEMLLPWRPICDLGKQGRRYVVGSQDKGGREGGRARQCEKDE